MHLWYDLFQVILQLDLSHCWRLTSVIFTFGVSGSFHPVILQFTGIDVGSQSRVMCKSSTHSQIYLIAFKEAIAAS